MILTRLLAPDQFGLMALVLAASLLFEAFTEVGVRQAVVQNKKGDTDAFLNVAWWFNAVRGLVLYGLGVFCARWVAGIYDEPLLAPLLRVSLLTVLLQGLVSPRLYVLEKQLKFGLYVWVTQGAGLGGTAISLVAALLVPDVWALVLGFVSEAALRCVGSFLVCPLRPRLVFHRDCWRDLFVFSRGMVGLPVLTFVFTRADLFVLGRMRDKEELGLYFMALVLAEVPATLLTKVIQPMVLPVLSSMQDNLKRLRSTLIHLTYLLFAFGGPLAVCMVIFSRETLLLAYGRPYTVMARQFALFAVFFLFYTAGGAVFSAYLALGRPGLHRTFSIVRVVLMLLVIYPSILWFGSLGAAGARLICLLLASVVQIVMLSSIMEMPVRVYFTAIARGMVTAVVVAVAGLLLRFAWGGTAVTQMVFAAALCGLAWCYEGVRFCRAPANGRPTFSSPSVTMEEM
jgi:O-antigen/teichoic acid export membrane protein